jgi:hypothetical protein
MHRIDGGFLAARQIFLDLCWGRGRRGRRGGARLPTPCRPNTLRCRQVSVTSARLPATASGAVPRSADQPGQRVPRITPPVKGASPPATAFGGCGSDLQVLIHASGSFALQFPPPRPSQPSDPVETSYGSAPSRAEGRRFKGRPARRSLPRCPPPTVRSFDGREWPWWLSGCQRRRTK